jgi:hypothetical protein
VSLPPASERLDIANSETAPNRPKQAPRRHARFCDRTIVSLPRRPDGVEHSFAVEAVV